MRKEEGNNKVMRCGGRREKGEGRREKKETEKSTVTRQKFPLWRF
jgi:hypothetical protein